MEEVDVLIKVLIASIAGLYNDVSDSYHTTVIRNVDVHQGLP